MKSLPYVLIITTVAISPSLIGMDNKYRKFKNNNVDIAHYQRNTRSLQTRSMQEVLFISDQKPLPVLLQQMKLPPEQALALVQKIVYQDRITHRHRSIAPMPSDTSFETNYLAEAAQELCEIAEAAVVFDKENKTYVLPQQ